MPARRVLAIAALLAACAPPGVLSGTDAARDVRTPDGAPPLDAAPPDGGVPATAGNRWELVRTDSDFVPWETGVAYDPIVQRVVQHGGHMLGSYAQSSYTTRYDVARDVFESSLSPSRPQRRCIVELAYASSIGRTITVHGGAEHGSVPIGRVAFDGTRVARSDSTGPWLYDALADRWEEARPFGEPWPASAHSPIAYDPGSDAIFSIVGDSLMAYSLHTNVVAYRSLPGALSRRLAYAMALEPRSRTLLVFGGTGPRSWVWEDDPIAFYDAEVHGDTWLYDIASDTWREVDTTVRPPRGVPLAGHVRLSTIFHPPSRTALLLQVPLETGSLDPATWPAMELWSFDFSTERWARVETLDGPELPGILVYDSDRDLLVHFGGGRDTGRPGTSRHLYRARIEVPGHPLGPVAEVPRIAVRTRADGAREIMITGEVTGPLALERAAIVRELPGAYAVIATVDRGTTSYLDAIEGAGRAAYRLVDERTGSAGVAAFDVPPPPRGLVAAIEGGAVRLRWNGADPDRVTEHRVYRARGGRGVAYGDSTELGRVASGTTTFVDETVALGDGIHAYFVRAVDPLGRTTGASALAYTVPDAPLGLDAVVSGDAIRVTWSWPEGAGSPEVVVYAVDRHLNTHGRSAADVEAWWNEWREVGRATEPGELLVPFAPTEERPHLYFYARARHEAGPLGFYTDLVSATDPRFPPAQR
jgi:hypothetical protein